MTENKRASPFLSFIGKLFRREQAAPAPAQDNTDTIGVAELLAIFGDDNPVTVTEALQIPSFSACVSLIADTLATMPVQLYSESEGHTSPLKGDGRVILINDDTGDILNGVQFKTALVRDYLLYGNGYAYIRREGNRIISLHYVSAKEVSVCKSANPIFKDAVFVVSGGRYEEYDFIKLCRNSKDGVTGIGIVAEMSDLLTAQYKLLVFEKALAKSGGSKKGFLQAEKKLSEDAMAILRQKWKELYNKPDTEIMILNDGLKYTDANQTSVEMQLCELMKDGAEKIYHACGVPSGLLSGTGTDDMWSMFYKTALLPVQKAFEATLNRDLLLYSEKTKLYFAFETKELLKGDTLKRYQAYEIALRAGFIQADEVRYAEDMEALNLGFIKLGLQDVLYNPKTQQIYTPNTNSFVKVGENSAKIGLQQTQDGAIMSMRDNPYHDPENGEFTSGPGGVADGSQTTSSGDSQDSSSISSIDHLRGSEYALAVYEKYASNPKTMGETTPKQKYDDLVAHGVDVLPLGRGAHKGKPFTKGGGFRVTNLPNGKIFMYHPPERSHHDNDEYYKLSEGNSGKPRRYKMDGTLKERK